MMDNVKTTKQSEIQKKKNLREAFLSDRKLVLLEQIKTVGKSVCQIWQNSEPKGSGFLIKYKKDQEEMFGLMTNNHVIRWEDFISEVVHYELNFESLDELRIDLDSSNCSIVFNSPDEAMDVTLCMLSDANINLLKENGAVWLEHAGSIKVKDQVFIIQHTVAEEHVGYALYDSGVVTRMLNYLMYHTVNTEGGSSGSPVVKLTRHFKNCHICLVGLHRGGCDNTCNEATNVEHILSQVLKGVARFVELKEDCGDPSNNHPNKCKMDAFDRGSTKHRSVIIDCEKVLLRSINCDARLLVSFENYTDMDPDTLQYIKAEATQNNRNRRLLNMMLRCSEEQFENIASVFFKENQEHVGNLLTGITSGKQPLSDKSYKCLISNKCLLMKRIDCTDNVLTKIKNLNILADTDLENILAKQIPSEKKAFLLDAIMRRSEDDLKALEQILEQEEQKDVARLLYEVETLNLNCKELTSLRGGEKFTGSTHESQTTGREKSDEQSIVLIGSDPGGSIIVYFHLESVEATILYLKLIEEGKLREFLEEVICQLLGSCNKSPITIENLRTDTRHCKDYVRDGAIRSKDNHISSCNKQEKVNKINAPSDIWKDLENSTSIVQIIKDNEEVLIRSIDPNVSFMSRLSSEGVLDEESLQEIEAEANSADKNKRLLKILLERSFEDRINFVRILQEEKQEHVANLVIGCTREPQILSSESYHRLEKTKGILVKKIYWSESLYEKLQSTQILNRTDYERIESKKDCRGKTIELIDAIMRRSEDDMQQLKEIFQQLEQDTVVKILSGGLVTSVHLDTSRPEEDEEISDLLNSFELSIKDCFAISGCLILQSEVVEENNPIKTQVVKDIRKAMFEIHLQCKPAMPAIHGFLLRIHTESNFEIEGILTTYLGGISKEFKKALNLECSIKSLNNGKTIVISEGSCEYIFHSEVMDATFFKLSPDDIDVLSRANVEWLSIKSEAKIGEEILLIQKSENASKDLTNVVYGKLIEISNKEPSLHLLTEDITGAKQCFTGSPIVAFNGKLIGLHCGIISDGHIKATNAKSILNAILADFQNSFQCDPYSSAQRFSGTRALPEVPKRLQERHKQTLLRSLNCNAHLTARLVLAGVVENQTRLEIDVEKSEFRKNGILLQQMSNFTSDKYEKFLEILREENQEHVANLLTDNMTGKQTLSLRNYKILKQNKRRLIDKIHLSDNLLKSLKDMGVFTSADYACMESKLNSFEKKMTLIDALMRGSEEDFEMFQQALILQGQDNITHILCRALTNDEIKQRLDNIPRIISAMCDPKGRVLDDLHSECVISAKQYRMLEEAKDEERWRKLMDMLHERQHPNGYVILLQCLEQEYKWIVDSIYGDKYDTNYNIQQRIYNNYQALAANFELKGEVLDKFLEANIFTIAECDALKVSTDANRGRDFLQFLLLKPNPEACGAFLDCLTKLEPLKWMSILINRDNRNECLHKEYPDLTNDIIKHRVLVNYSEIVADFDPTGYVLDWLFQERILTADMYRQLYKDTPHGDRGRALLLYLCQISHPTSFLALLRSLQKEGHREHIIDLLINDRNDNNAMKTLKKEIPEISNEVIRKRLKKNFAKFVAGFVPKGMVLDGLCAAKVINARKLQEYYNMKERDRGRKLITDLLFECHPRAFVELYNIMKEGGGFEDKIKLITNDN